MQVFAPWRLCVKFFISSHVPVNQFESRSLAPILVEFAMQVFLATHTLCSESSIWGKWVYASNRREAKKLIPDKYSERRERKDVHVEAINVVHTADISGWCIGAKLHVLLNAV